MQITIDTAQPLTETDRAVLKLLVLDAAPAADQSEEKTAPRRRAATKKAEPAPEPEPEPEEAEEDEPEEDLVGSTAPTLDDAVARATELVSTGKSAEVKAALKAAGAARVSELKGDAIQKFLDAL